MIGLTKTKVTKNSFSDNEFLYLNYTVPSGTTFNTAALTAAFPAFTWTVTADGDNYVVTYVGEPIPCKMKWKNSSDTVAYDDFSYDSSISKFKLIVAASDLANPKEWTLMIYPQSAYLVNNGYSYDANNISPSSVPEGNKPIVESKDTTNQWKTVAYPRFAINGKAYFSNGKMYASYSNTESGKNYSENGVPVLEGFGSIPSMVTFTNSDLIYSPFVLSEDVSSYNTDIAGTSGAFRLDYAAGDLLLLEDREKLEIYRSSASQLTIRTKRYCFNNDGHNHWNFGKIGDSHSSWKYEITEDKPNSFTERTVYTKTVNFDPETEMIVAVWVEPTDNSKNLTWVKMAQYLAKADSSEKTLNECPSNPSDKGCAVLKGAETKIAILDFSKYQVTPTPTDISPDVLRISFMDVSTKLSSKIKARIQGWHNSFGSLNSFQLVTQYYPNYTPKKIYDQLIESKIMSPLEITSTDSLVYITPNKYMAKQDNSEKTKQYNAKTAVGHKEDYEVSNWFFGTHYINRTIKWIEPRLVYEIPLFYQILGKDDKLKFYHDRYICSKCHKFIDASNVDSSTNKITQGHSHNCGAEGGTIVYYNTRWISQYSQGDNDKHSAFNVYNILYYDGQNQFMTNIPGIGDFNLDYNYAPCSRLINTGGTYLCNVSNAKNIQQTISPWWMRWDKDSPNRIRNDGQSNSPAYSENGAIERIYKSIQKRSVPDSNEDKAFRKMGDYLQNMWGAYTYDQFDVDDDDHELDVKNSTYDLFSDDASLENDDVWFQGLGGIIPTTEFQWSSSHSGWQANGNLQQGAEGVRDLWLAWYGTIKRNSSSVCMDWYDNNNTLHRYYMNYTKTGDNAGEAFVCDSGDKNDRAYMDRNCMYNTTSNVCGAIALYKVKVHN